jgi:septal ring factor EnvC (AmiA/AmiB activator)
MCESAALQARIAELEQNYKAAVHGRGEFRFALTESRQQLATVTAERDDLRQTVERLEKVLKGDAIIESLNYQSGSSLDIVLSHPMQASIVSGFADMLDQSGAENYLEMQMTKEGKRFVLTIQRSEKPTAHELRRQAEQQLATLTAERDQAQAILARQKESA